MNHALPPGNRGHRGADPGRTPRLARIVPGAGRLVGGVAHPARQEPVAVAHIAPCARRPPKVVL